MRRATPQTANPRSEAVVETRIWPKKLAGLLALAGLWAVTVGCTYETAAAPAPQDGGAAPASVPFQGVAQGSSNTAGLKDPTIFVAGSEAEANQLLQALGGRGLNRLQGFDYATNWLVAVFAGQKGSSGHGITVTDVAAAPGSVRLSVELTAPAPGAVGLTVLTYPYHVIAIPRAGLDPAPGTVWAAHTPDGTLLAQTTYP